jgi:radical SAM superfamily enzyme YgiQ (UPF0313 family)
MNHPSPKILFTTVYRHSNYYDYFETNTRSYFRPSTERVASYGLRFLKQNVPELEIIEYPTWAEYRKKLAEGWDVVGFSFYLNEIHEIIEMADAARSAGIKELWAGNYGALTDGMESQFDRIFSGYSEAPVAAAFGKKIERILHPPLVQILRLGPVDFPYLVFGVLFTERGCPIRCNFCQTPVFCPQPSKIPLESIEAILKYYSQLGIKQIMLLDENFGIFKNHTEAVIELLARYGFFWWVMVRADRVVENIDRWIKKGFASGFIGVESLSPAILNQVGKRESIEMIVESIRKMHAYDCYVGNYYIVGFEQETEESIRADIEKLARLRGDYNQVCVLTPLPKTGLWSDIDKKYGIFERDFRRYNMKHLVFNHPNIRPAAMERLLTWSFRRLNTPSVYFDSIKRLCRRYLNHGESFRWGWRRMLWSNPTAALGFDNRQQRFLAADPG